MIDIPFPIVLLLAGALYWPVTLGIAAVLAGIGLVFQHRWLRVACFTLTALLLADCLLAIWVN